MSKIFKPRRGTANTMSTVKSNTVLAAGELFAEVPNTGQGTGKGRLVMGDGVTSYGNLPSFLENTDVSTAQVTVTADNSQTSTAALNNVATGATTGAIVGSLKQAISLTKSELSSSIDEVYQAALSAGSGGIRWNSSTKYIQIMDENKNWIDWRHFDTTTSYSLIPVMSSYGSGEGHIITCSTPAGSYYGYLAANNSNAQGNQFFANGLNVFWQIYFPYEVYVEYIELWSNNASGEYWNNSGCRMKFEGSNDATYWSLLYSGLLGATGGTGVKVTLLLSNRESEDPYQYYKLTFLDYSHNSSGSGMGIIQFYGYKI